MVSRVFARSLVFLTFVLASTPVPDAYASSHAGGARLTSESATSDEPARDPTGSPSSTPPSSSTPPPSSVPPGAAPPSSVPPGAAPPVPADATERPVSDPVPPSRQSDPPSKGKSDNASSGAKSSPVPVTPQAPRPPVFNPAELTAPSLPSDSAVNAPPAQPDILVSSDSPAAANQAAQQAQTLGLALISQDNLNSLNIVLSKFRSPQGVPSAQALAQLRIAAPGILADVDTAYILQDKKSDPKHYGRALLSWPNGAANCKVSGSIGMIDTAVDAKHPAFESRQIVQKSFVPADYESADTKHGTGVAGILLGLHPKGNIEGYVPDARLFSASIFYDGRGQSSTSTELIVNALDWLGSRFVSVINLSFAGKGDVILERATQISASQNRVLVAAAGNFGPKARPAYPAAYPHVLAVTALDNRKKLYKSANTGDYIDFAAPGVDIWTTAPKGKGAFRSGTSFASPAVASILLALGAVSNAADARQRLASSVIDLGQPGRDPLYGYGLVQAPESCE